MWWRLRRCADKEVQRKEEPCIKKKKINSKKNYIPLLKVFTISSFCNYYPYTVYFIYMYIKLSNLAQYLSSSFEPFHVNFKRTYTQRNMIINAFCAIAVHRIKNDPLLTSSDTEELTSLNKYINKNVLFFFNCYLNTFQKEILNVPYIHNRPRHSESNNKKEILERKKKLKCSEEEKTIKKLIRKFRIYFFSSRLWI